MMKFVVPLEQSGNRVDKFLQSVCNDYSRTDLQKLLMAGKVFFQEKAISKNFRVEEGMEIVMEALPEKEASTLEPENIPLNIIYEDEDIVVLNKPKNLVVHPGNGVKTGTLAAGLLYHFKESLSSINGPLRPGIVHRLDKDTPGLMLVAKNDQAHRHLAKQLESHSLARTYRALVWGNPRDWEGMIDAPVGRDVRNRLKQAVTKSGKQARTHFKALEFFTFASLLEYQLETGRTHQIRVHSRYMGNPVFGDPLYEGRNACLTRVPPLLREIAETALNMTSSQLLQAVKIRFIHPRTEQEMEFEIPVEEEFAQVLEYLSSKVKSDAPDFSMEAFHAFEADMRFDDESDFYEIEEDEYEAPVRKERMTRAERLAKKKERLAKKKEIELERKKREAEKRGENPDSVVAPGYEPTIDPNLV